MLKRKCRIIQLSQGDIAREVFQIAIVAARVLRQPMTRRHFVGERPRPCAHQIPRQQQATVGPQFRVAQTTDARGPFNDQRRRVRIVAAPHPVQKPLIPQPRIVLQPRRHRRDQSRHAILVSPQRHPRRGQRRPILGHARHHPQAFIRPTTIPQDAVQPHLVGDFDRSTVQGQKLAFLGPVEFQRSPSPLRLGLGICRPPRRIIGLDQGQRA